MQIIRIIFIDYRRSNGEHCSGVGNATVLLLHGIVDDLEKVRVPANRQRVERVGISPMTIIVGVSETSTRCKGPGYPHQTKNRREVAVLRPLLAVRVAYTVVTGVPPGSRYQYLQVIHVPPCA